MRSRDRLYLSPISFSVSSSSSSRPKRHRMMRDSMGVSVLSRRRTSSLHLLVGEVVVGREGVLFLEEVDEACRPSSSPTGRSRENGVSA